MPPPGDRRAEDRYEPLPSLPRLPRYVWSRLPLPARIALGCVPLLAVALALMLAPGIDRSKDERARSEALREQRARDARVAELRAEQRPRFARSQAVVATGAPAERRLDARERQLAGVSATLLGDARARVRAGELNGSVGSVECEPFPRTVEGVGAERDLARRRGRYSCVAVTARIRGSDAEELGVIGHPYRVMVDFETGRYAFCKISGRPGEGMLTREIAATVPRACGGR